MDGRLDLSIGLDGFQKVFWIKNGFQSGYVGFLVFRLLDLILLIG
jgi:hypothetical protein